MGMSYKFVGSASYSRFGEEFLAVKDFLQNSGLELPKAFTKWSKDPYKKLTLQETKDMYKFIRHRKAKLRKISSQIVEEFECCYRYDCPWQVFQ